MSPLDAAHRAGRQACADAKPMAANPHLPDVAEHDEWVRGWRAEYATLPPPLQAVRDAKEATA